MDKDKQINGETTVEYYIRENNRKEIFEFIRSIKGIHSKDEKRIRSFIEAVWYVARSGCQWRLLSKVYSSYRSIDKKFKRWCEKGIWEKLLEYIKQLEVALIDD